jgi:copper chaperone NosL
MNIVEKKFGAEIVTKKGKVYKYDAIECMVNAIKKMDKNSIQYFMAVDYNNPTQLMDATTSFHLKSEEIPSPMGAFLSSYVNKELADKAQEINGGQIYSWEVLKEKFNN